MPNRDKMEIAITGGMRQDLSEHNAPPGTIVDALNVRFAAVGEVEARPGTTALSVASDCDVGYAGLAGANPGLLARLPSGFAIGAEGYGFRYDAAKERLHIGASYANAEPLGVFNVLAREEIAATGAVPWPLSQAASNGYVCTVYSCGNGQGNQGPGDNTVVLMVHTEAGTLVLSAQIASVSTGWVVLDGSDATGATFALITQTTGAGLSARLITTTATGASLGSATVLPSMTSSASYWAACTWPGIGWALVYQSAAAVITLAKMAGVTVSATQTASVTGTVPVSVYADATHVYVGWRDGSGAPYSAIGVVLDTGLAGTTLPVTLESEVSGAYIGPPLFGPSIAAASAMYVISRWITRIYDDETRVIVGELSAVGVDTSIGFTHQCVAASAPFGPGYVWVTTGGGFGTSDLTERAVLLDFMGLRSSEASTALRELTPVVALSGATSPPGTSVVGIGFYRHHLAPPAELSDGSLVAGIVRLVRNEYQGLTAAGLGLAEWLRFSVGGARKSVPFGDAALVAGWPTLSEVNSGTRHVSTATTLGAQRDGIDLGFPQSPGIETPVGSNGAGSLSSGAAYQWRAVIERVDSRGRRWRSAPSPIASLTLGAAEDTVALAAFANVWMLRAQTGVSDFVMHFYRTAANGSTFYRCTPPQGAPVAASDGEFTFSDELSDALLTVREILYTDGGVLPNDPPPSCRFISCTEDRVWLAGLWETEQLQSSKILVPGEPPQFSDLPAFRVVLPEPCTGIAVQDGVVVAFTRRTVYAIQGGGPNDQGQGAWDSPRSITRSTGCIAHRSILETSVGIFFQSDQGIELLPRGMGEPQFIGMPVQDLMFDNDGTVREVISAAVVTTLRGRTARFVVDDGSLNLLLVYDLDTLAWSRDTYGALGVTGIVDTDEGAVMPLQLASITNGYGVLRESVAQDTDSVGNTPAEIASSLEWAELRPFGVAGQGRFTGAVALFDGKGAPSGGYRAGNATIKLSIDRASENGLTFNMNTLNGADYRKNTAATDAGTAGKLTLATTVGGWRFVGWSVEVDDRGGGRRMGETEQG
jgi:hypothetical protein